MVALETTSSFVSMNHHKKSVLLFENLEFTERNPVSFLWIFQGTQIIEQLCFMKCHSIAIIFFQLHFCTEKGSLRSKIEHYITCVSKSSESEIFKMSIILFYFYSTNSFIIWCSNLSYRLWCTNPSALFPSFLGHLLM